MTTLEAINKIKQMFAEAGELPMASVEPTQSFAEYSLKSGAKVMIDKLEVGGKVSVVDEAGVEEVVNSQEEEGEGLGLGQPPVTVLPIVTEPKKRVVSKRK